jgi:D-3-phosphoglycerate dehydrogenase
VIVNCARAGIIDEEALRKARSEKKIRFCNDVYPKDAPGKKTVADIADLMLPHLGASTFESNYNAARRAAEQLIDLWEKGITRYIVNLRIPPELDEKYQELVYHITRLARAWLGGKPVRQIEASFYGKLEPFSKWMLSPIVSALDPDFDFHSGEEDALAQLAQKGIDYTVRKPDNAKNYGESITLDLFCGSERLDRVSVRGTVTEGAFMISRIQDFHKLYFDPLGHALFFTYIDRPAVLGNITSVLGKHSINIHDVRAPHNSTQDLSMAVLKVDKPVSDEIVSEIREKIQAEIGFYVNL